MTIILFFICHLKPVWQRHSSKYLFLCMCNIRKNVNTSKLQNFFSGWTVPLRSVKHLYCGGLRPQIIPQKFICGQGFKLALFTSIPGFNTTLSGQCSCLWISDLTLHLTHLDLRLLYHICLKKDNTRRSSVQLHVGEARLFVFIFSLKLAVLKKVKLQWSLPLFVEEKKSLLFCTKKKFRFCVSFYKIPLYKYFYTSNFVGLGKDTVHCDNF